MPKSRVDYWRAKLEGNKNRDIEIKSRLEDEGWSVLEAWECQTSPSRLPDLSKLIDRFLKGNCDTSRKFT